MIRIAVCEDEKVYLDKIKAILGQYAEDKGVLFEICAFDSSSDLKSPLFYQDKPFRHRIRQYVS